MLKGLSSTQVSEQKAKFGSNVISERPKKTKLLKFLEQFNNFLIYLLLGAAIVSFVIGDTVDGILILAIVVINAFFGFYQEAKAEDALAVLKKMTITKVRVFRDGTPREIDSRELVPGDVIFLEEGSKIPADAVVSDPVNLEVNEASLTGESMPVSKNKNDTIYLGTIVTRGRCYARVSAIGMSTSFGSIAETLSEVEEEKTPLEKKLSVLTRAIGIIGLAAGTLVFALSFFQGGSYLLAFLLAISLAVAIVPEGLPVVMTLTLAIGVREMAKKRTIVRKLSSIEALGSITLIATDKTGTLTENKMTVAKVYIAGHDYTAQELQARIPTDELLRIFENGILCSTASLVPIQESSATTPLSKIPLFEVLGDPTEGAVLLMAASFGIDTEEVRRGWEVVDEIPFDSKTRMMSVVVKRGREGHGFAKGSPEAILDICSLHKVKGGMTALKDKEKDHITSLVNAWASSGLRIMAFSYIPNPHLSLEEHTKRKDFVFLGLMGLYDAPRAEVREAIEDAHSAGIKVVMVTGDNEKTAEAIAAEVGILGGDEETLNGHELVTYTDEELLRILPRVRVFARVKPEDKYRIIKLYQRLGEIVAVTGDGVNDAVALKQANVGVAMGKIGTDVARDVSDIVITDDNFATIISAIAEGRNIVKNLKNSVKYLLSGNLAEAAALIGGFLIGIPALFFAIQILFINLISDSLPALALAFSPRSPTLMKKKPEKTLELMGKRDQAYVYALGLMGAVLVIVSYLLFKEEKVARTGAFAVICMIQSFIFIDLWLNRGAIIPNRHLLQGFMFYAAFLLPFVLQYVIVYTPFLRSIFKITVVSPPTFLYFVAISTVMLIPVVILRMIVPTENHEE